MQMHTDMQMQFSLSHYNIYGERERGKLFYQYLSFLEELKVKISQGSEHGKEKFSLFVFYFIYIVFTDIFYLY